MSSVGGLTPEQWATPSLCEGWEVHDVLAHQLETAKESRRRLLRRFAAAGFDFDRYNQRGVRAERRADPADTLAAFREASTLTATPPAPLASRLVEVFVHGEDIRRPLGITGDYPVEGLRVHATDTDLDLGEGPAVEGPAISVLLVLCGRAVALDELSGPGVETLAGRR